MNRPRTEALPGYHARFYATFFLDVHGFMLETVTYEKVAPVDP
jgi:hypothetical protein